MKVKKKLIKLISVWNPKESLNVFYPSINWQSRSKLQPASFHFKNKSANGIIKTLTAASTRGKQFYLAGFKTMKPMDIGNKSKQQRSFLLI